MDLQPQLDRHAAAALLGVPDPGLLDLRQVHTDNHVWRVETIQGTYFVKTHTKDWYAARPASGVPVRNEVSGHRILRAAGLPAAEVVDYDTGRDNPMGWPYVITRELPGTPLTELLPVLDRHHAAAALTVTGEYLAGMHCVTYEHPGSLVDGPPGPPDLDEWLHWLSRLERFLLYFFENLITDDLPLSIKDAATGLLADTLPALRDSYVPLRFVHGDCHSSTFFIEHGSTWRVSGMVDLENCSSGNPLFDFAKLMIEMAGRFGARDLWWQPLFEGYGSEPDLDLVRTILIGHAHINYACHGPFSWRGDREQILRQLLTARSWAELFDQ